MTESAADCSTASIRAFVDKDAVATWLPPGDMKGVVHIFEACQGGAIRMSLVYPEADAAARGKTTARADTFHGRFVRLIPGKLVVWATQFESTDPRFAGEMTVSTTIESAGRDDGHCQRVKHVEPVALAARTLVRPIAGQFWEPL